MSDRMLRDGRQIGNYRIVRLLGTGGFAEVYLGEHIHLNTLAAIKLLHTHIASAEVGKFRREAGIVAGLRHPNIVTINDFGIEAGLPYLIMDYAPNGTLRQRIPKGYALTPHRVSGYIAQIGAALDFAHQSQVVHRDVKPENMLIGSDGEIVLSDFGIATVMVDSINPGTRNAAYMAPEQLKNHPRPASDQYSLAVVVYEWLCGERPFNGQWAEVVAQHLHSEVPPLRELNSDIAPALEEVVLIALSKDPVQRFPTVGDFVKDFKLAMKPTRRNYGTKLPVAMPAFPNVPQRQQAAEKASPSRPLRVPGQEGMLSVAAQRAIDKRRQVPIDILESEEEDSSTAVLSRRVILAGLGGLAVAGGSIGWWWIYNHR